MSDGCTWSPDRGWWGDHSEACVWHDQYYYYGGSRAERRRADLRFRLDLIEIHHVPRPIAWLYYLAVRVGGHPRFRRKHSWAYGDNHFRYDEEPAVPREEG